jgi:catechol 2,3-dioxygenase-like lactoylglutathione lyase family enzyme
MKADYNAEKTEVRIMAKLRHLAIATDDPDRTARFYEDVFEFTRLREAKGKWGHGYILSDGTINLAILNFETDEAAGVEKGKAYVGLHHIGFEVDDVDALAARVQDAGAVARHDINDALGLSHEMQVKGEFKFSGPDGVVFDLSEPGIWKLS